MEKINRKEINAITGEEIVVELTAQEIADRAELAEANEAARLADESAKANAKAAILDRLGLTAEEAKLLIS
jgi:hypothetical protein